jgi:hypothetical protein
MAPPVALATVPLLLYVAGGVYATQVKTSSLLVEGARVLLEDNNFMVASMRGRLMEGSVGRQHEE